MALELTVTLPDPNGRNQSLMIVSQDHSISVAYGPSEVVLSEDVAGTRLSDTPTCAHGATDSSTSGATEPTSNRDPMPLRALAHWLHAGPYIDAFL